MGDFPRRMHTRRCCACFPSDLLALGGVSSSVVMDAPLPPLPAMHTPAPAAQQTPLPFDLSASLRLPQVFVPPAAPAPAAAARQAMPAVPKDDVVTALLLQERFAGKAAVLPCIALASAMCE